MEDSPAQKWWDRVEFTASTADLVQKVIGLVPPAAGVVTGLVASVSTKLSVWELCLLGFAVCVLLGAVLVSVVLAKAGPPLWITVVQFGTDVARRDDGLLLAAHLRLNNENRRTVEPVQVYLDGYQARGCRRVKGRHDGTIVRTDDGGALEGHSSANADVAFCVSTPENFVPEDVVARLVIQDSARRRHRANVAFRHLIPPG